MSSQQILDNSSLIIKENCKIVNDTLYEKCEFDDILKRENFVNDTNETYYLNSDNHVYRVFLSEDDYDYITDIETLKVLNDLFK